MLVLPFRLAHPWPGSHIPHDRAGEQTFVASLPRSSRKRFDRNDVTWLLTALRSGTTVAALRDLAPGVDLIGLRAAYRGLEARRREASDAWSALCDGEDPTHLVPIAYRILPVPVTQISAAGGPTAEAARRATAEIRRVWQLCDSVASLVERLAAGDPLSAQLEARRLWDPSGYCLWNSPFFLPRRVGELTPLRASDLLGAGRGEEMT